MRISRRRVAAVLVFAGACTLVALVLGQASGSHSTATRAAIHASHLESGEQAEAAGGADAQAYADRAYPGSEVTINEIQGAIKANAKVAKHDPRLNAKWNFIGPDTLDVDRLGTQSFVKPTQWSGRVTALAIDPNCTLLGCKLYLAAAGGGVWKTTNALAPTAHWTQISQDIPTNAIGSIAIDPNDASGQTVYVGTGEGNSSGDSEAGLGLYKSIDGGAHWSRVPGSFAVANNRAITWIAIEPGNASHILIGTRSGTRGEGSNATSTATVPAQSPPVGVYNSTDGGATFALTQAGSVNEVKFDPSNANVVYATLAGSATGGLLRSTSGGAAGTWEPIFQENRGRFSFSPVALANGKTRIYLTDASTTLVINSVATAFPAQVYRIDDASGAASDLTAPCTPATATAPLLCGNAAWTRLSNPTDGTPGFAVHNYCNTPLVGSQCSYDQFVLSPPDRPDMVVVGGLMHYEELKPYVLQAAEVVGTRSNGRAVLMSTDAGANWTDMTGDVGGESMHPDQHAIAFVPGNPDQFFVGSDGGIIRTSGQWADASSQCDTRNLPSALDLADCHAWLSRIPTVLTVMNAGLATLQMNSISVSPYSPDDTAMTGTQDNGTLAFTGSTRWYLPLTGDGGNSGFDATDPHLRFHTYTGGQMDVNYNDTDPTSWLWIGDRFIVNFPEAQRFYAPVISDPIVSKTIFVGAQSIWRTQNAGGDRAFLEAHCNTAIGEFPSDLLYTGACGTAADWPKLGTSTLTNSSVTPPSPYGTTKGGGTLSSIARGNDAGTMWSGTGSGRVLISQNVNAADPASVTFTRVDTTSQPGRAVSSVYADPTNANHAIVTFSGYDATTPTTPGHVFDVVYNPATSSATWTDLSYDIGDQPVNDAVLDVATGDVYISTDFGVYRLVSGTHTWVQAADGLPMAAVSGLTLAASKKTGDRLLYAATHGRSAYRLRLR